MSRFVRLVSLFALATLAGASPARATNVELRLATQAPGGSQWRDVLDKGQAELRSKTGGRVTLNYSPAAQHGDERDLVRKLSQGQLDGAELTSVGLSMIDESIRVLELPMMFRTVEELDYVADRMWPYFQKKFEKKGYRLNDRGEVGWIQHFTRNKVDSLATLKAQKLCLVSDDSIARAFYGKLGLNGVPLAVPEVTAWLTSGRINGCYGSPTAATSLKWDTKVSFMTSMPTGFAMSATVIPIKAMTRLSAEDTGTFEAIDKATYKRLRQVSRKSNEDAVLSMTRRGLIVVTTPPAMVAELENAAREVWTALAGKVYSQQELDLVLKHRGDYRAKRKGAMK